MTIFHSDNAAYKHFTTKAEVERDLQNLIGIIKGIVCDQVINEAELDSLATWIDMARMNVTRQPYTSIIENVTEAIADKILTEDEQLDIIWLCELYINETGYYSGGTSGLQQLHGLMNGISADNVINEKEIKYLDNWLEDNYHLKNCWPFDEVYSMITRMLADKVITENEKDELLKFCKAISPGESTTNFIETLKMGYCQIEPDIIIPKNSFCVTGVSRKFKRKDIHEKIKSYGGIVTESINKNLNYLVVCDEKNSCWAYTCYGRKIETVIKHRTAGHNIVIVHEFDLHDALESIR